MEVSIENLQGLERRLKVTLPATDVSNAYTKKLDEIQKRANIKGYRPGKVPLRVIKQRFGDSIKYEVAEELMRNTLEKALAQEDVNPAGFPKIEPPETVEIDQPFEYSALFEIFPEIELTLLEGVSFTKKIPDIADADIDMALTKLQEQHAEWKSVDRKAKEGDKLEIDFLGKMDGVPFQGGKAEKFSITLGSKQMIPGFEEGLIGCEAGKPTVLKVTFPTDYHHPDYAGKDAEFDITVHKVEEALLPNLDEDLIKKLGFDSGKLEELRTQIKDNLTTDLANRLEDQLKISVFDKLVELNTINIPTALVLAEANSLMQIKKQEDQIHDIEKINPEVKAQAELRVHRGLLVQEVIKKFSIKAGAEHVKAKIEKMCAIYDNPEQMQAMYYNNKEMLAQIEAIALEEQVLEKLLEDAELTEQKISFSDFEKKS